MTWVSLFLQLYKEDNFTLHLIIPDFLVLNVRILTHQLTIGCWVDLSQKLGNISRLVILVNRWLKIFKF